MSEERKRKNHEYYLTHKQYFRDFMRNWSRNHKDEVSQYRKTLKLKMLIHYAGNPPKCACCGESELRFLTIDHTKGNGAEHRKQITGDPQKCSGSSIFQWILKNNFPEGFQVLCMNCNMAKSNSKVQFCPVHHPELYY